MLQRREEDISRIVRSAGNTARLSQTPQKSLRDSQGNEAFVLIQQQLDSLKSAIANEDTPKGATVSAYPYSPQISINVNDKLTRLEARLDDGMKQIMSLVGNRAQGKTAVGHNIAAYQQLPRQFPGDELSYLRERACQFGEIMPEHQNIAAFQPAPRESYRPNVESEELRRLREENRILKTAQRGPQPQQNHFNNNERWDDLQLRMFEEIH